MKNNIISNWIALLLTVSGMAVLPLSAMATATSSITSGTTVSDGALNLTAKTGASDIALEVVNADTKYTVDTASVFNSAQTGNRWGPVVSVDAAFLRIQAGGTINSYTQNATGLLVTNGGTLTVTGGLTVNVASKDATGINIRDSYASLGDDVRIINTNSNAVANTGGNAALSATNAVVTIGDRFQISGSYTGPYAMLNVLNNSQVTIGNEAEILTYKLAIAVARAARLTFGNNLQLTHNGGSYSTINIEGGALELGTDATINSSGLRVIGYTNAGGTVTGSNTRIIYRGTDYAVRFADGGNALLHLENPTIKTDTAAGIFTVVGRNGVKTVEIIGGTIDAPNTPLINTSTNGNGSANTMHVTVSAGARLITNGLINDEVTTGGTVTLTLDHADATQAGGLTAGSGAQGDMTVNVNNGSGIIGDVVNNGHGNITINLDDTNLTGNSANTNDGSLTINGKNSGITSDLTASGTATIDVTVSGTGSSFTGDIAQHDDSTITVILDPGATGSGGFAGGNLITGGDSAWTFDKDSHGNNGENHGTWNIGDYEVAFDNLTNDGIININVNSDTGAGGSITVTDTADGDGKVHVDTTGNGQLNPNDVLPGIVSGEGTEHWQWDPIDWGIDEIIKDGDHFIKQGTSPAGAVLNSSVAIQQAMWFAQQNSLLKRMGDLRYGARASRPLAGGTPALHNLIENIWLRSYGQQLNVGSQVAGKAYEQLIYGVDLGTDHKFTLSADSDLYLGVYAGYSRSDLDYRTPGTDGEINSYYGGLYATWLHNSGFYIDATFKAASVDNDLKAPYGNTQLKASYSDVNLGGSLEIGKKFTFKDNWFIEPQLQVNYLHILAEDYTAGPMTISAQDLDALQLRIGSLFGRTINLTNSGALQPYIKISGVETISSGGTLRNGYQHTRANTDGARAELGAGLIWQLDTNNQLHLDYEASFGDKYDKPWGLTAGYRHQF
ncbi:MAG: autotransporter outer membrane beta-barrel domain-containing protein [Verrucomicrobiales bacterium]|jgi:outer membrane autotransporter protein|nr:autotransporter outer membrane beta-barrel domain-containing protein [Verrucomicrobiales bacterium]